jgi:phage-related minor tail protein
VADMGLRIGVEGEKDFRNALREINQEFKVLGSEMRLVSSEYDKNDKSVAAVTARTRQFNCKYIMNSLLISAKHQIKHRGHEGIYA